MTFDMKRITDPDALLLQGAADPTRLSILRQLSRDDAEVCACDFNACCEVAQPTVSHHLKVLREAGWVTSERRGSWVYYRLREDAVARFRGLAGELGGLGDPGTDDGHHHSSRAAQGPAVGSRRDAGQVPPAGSGSACAGRRSSRRPAEAPAAGRIVSRRS